jgi:glucose-fructose oxidoreductase
MQGGMKARIPRRQFLRNSLAAAAAASAFPTLIASTALGAEGRPAPSGRVNVGCIGVGPQGRGVMGGFLAQPDVQVVALCDVAQLNLGQALNQVKERYQGKGCETYGDFRQLLARKDVDAVLIATPDHWHVPAAIAAAKAGKDIYLEKPMGLSVAEDQMLRKACQRNKRVFQFGTQQRSSREFRRACELVRSGRIGKLQQINVWAAASRPGGSTKPAPVPAGLDYDFWLGPAPMVPYTEGKAFDNLPPNSWKTWWYNYDYALGFIAGWGVHPLDIAYWGHPGMMKGPVTIEGKGIFPAEGACNTSVAWEVDFKFADGVGMKYRGTRNGHDQVNELNDLRAWQEKYRKITDHGTAFEGTEGWVQVFRGGLVTSPEKLAEEPAGPSDVRLMNSPNHVGNFVAAVKTRGQTICPIEDSVQADILCHLSDIATRVKRKVTWDPAKEKFVGDPEANAKLGLRPMRKPWQL